jgi:hypothetical protein
MDYDLYIKVENGLSVGHPAFKVNLIDAFGAIPDDWEPFIRVPNPALTDSAIVLEHNEPVYRKVDGVWRDVWYTRPKNEEELAAEKEKRLDAIRGAWVKAFYASNFTAWVLNEEAERYEAPIPRPDDGKFYRWSGPDNNWKEAEPFPQDGKRYYFDFNKWANVEMANIEVPNV